MKSLFAFVTAALLVLSASAESFNDDKVFNVSKSDPELVYHTAAPGIKVTPRLDTELMVMAYDITIIPREGNAYFRWGHINENGEGQGFMTRWRDYDGVYSFTTPGIYTLETFAETYGKEKSSSLRVTFKVDYMGMTMAPGMMITPVGERGYNVSLFSLYSEELYYRWRHYESDVWYNWRLYTEPIPVTEGGQYVLDVNCEGDALGALIIVPSVDYYRTGDVNHNGTVNIEDVTALIDMLLNPEIMIGTGDVNKDGMINIADVATLIDMLLTSD